MADHEELAGQAIAWSLPFQVRLERSMAVVDSARSQKFEEVSPGSLNGSLGFLSARARSNPDLHGVGSYCLSSISDVLEDGLGKVEIEL